MRTNAPWHMLAVALLACAPAWAAPAHYVVFELDAGGRAVPVFYARVDLADERASAAKAAASSEDGGRRIAYRPWRRGVAGVSATVALPDLLRAEFARDAQTGLGEIEVHEVPNPDRSFVLRLPVDSADAVELLQPDGAQRFDLTMLARDANRLTLAAQVPLPELAPPVPPGNPANRVDILVLGDGYTAAEQATFDTNAAALQAAFFGGTPLKEYQSFVNWTTGFIPSNQSGADHPPYQAGCATTACCADLAAQSDPRAGQFPDTAFDARFCTSQIHRLLTINSSKVLAAAAAYPNWDRILVSVNDPVYGGSGGSIAVTSANASGPLIVIHEYGHSFSHLADEYSAAYPGYPACSDLTSPPCEANVTNQTSAAQVKWASLFTPGIQIPTPPSTPGTGLFEGARYLTSGMYRPTYNTCLMNYLGQPYCPVCATEYIRTLYRGGFGVPAGGIDLIEPGTESPPYAVPFAYTAGTSQLFQATLLQPSIGALDVKWYLDGGVIPGAVTPGYTFNQASGTPSSRTLELRVTDLTALVTPAMAGNLLVHSRTWNITVNAPADAIFANGFE